MQRFGFTQFQFLIAAVLLLAAGLKAYQLATAPLPPAVQGSVFTPLLELLNNRYFLMVVVVGEIFFALLLMSGIGRQWTWLLSLLGFMTFTLVSVMKGLSGEASCGCFGTITVNPWYTATFDAAIVGLLIMFRERIDWTLPALDRKKVLVTLVVGLILAVPALFAMLSLKQQPHATLGTEFTGSNGKRMILLEPETWIGKEFPLISRFAQPEGSEVLRQGMWTVLLIHTDCPKCQEIMADWERQKAERIAIVVVPSRTGEKVLQTSFPVFVLDSQNDWFATTPCAVKLDDGICVTVGEQIEE